MLERSVAEFLSGYFEPDFLSDMISNTKSQQSKSENRKLIQETFDIKKEDNKERLRNVYIPRSSTHRLDSVGSESDEKFAHLTAHLTDRFVNISRTSMWSPICAAVSDH